MGRWHRTFPFLLRFFIPVENCAGGQQIYGDTGNGRESQKCVLESERFVELGVRYRGIGIKTENGRTS